MNVLVTAGPTREYFDEVWFLSNPSSGRMGFEVARVFAEKGHTVTLISGPTGLTSPEGVEMRDAVLQHLAHKEVVVMAAAPVDYRPLRPQVGKMKKSGDKMVMELVRNPDILKEIGQDKGGRIHVGFALETTNLRTEAVRKLSEKNLDFIVANTPAAFAGDRTSVEILGRDGVVDVLVDVSKRELAHRLLELVEETATTRGLY